MPVPPVKDEERQARSIALEQAYVHDAYFHIAPHFLQKKYRAWPRVRHFIQGLEPGSLLADVGCGPGRYMGLGGSEVFHLGLDTCLPLLEAARKRGEQQVALGDNLSLPFRDESFDAALSVAVVHHFATRERRVQAIQELARILRIGGRVMITAWAMEQRHRKFESQDVLVPWNQPNKSSSEDPGSSAECEVTSTTTSDDDVLIYQAYNNRTSQDTEWSPALHRRSRFRDTKRHHNRGRSLDCPRSPSSSSDLSSPNETCYSFVRRALKKLSTSPYNYGSSSPYFYSSCRKPWLSDSMERVGGMGHPTEEEEDQSWDNTQLPIELRHLDEPPFEAREESSKKNRSLSDLFGILPNFLRSRSKEEKSAALVEIHKRISTASDPREYILRSMGLKNGIVRSKSTVSCMSRFVELRLPEEPEIVANKATLKEVIQEPIETSETKESEEESKPEEVTIEKDDTEREEDTLTTYYSMPELHQLQITSQCSTDFVRSREKHSKDVFQSGQFSIRPVSFPYLHREEGTVKRSVSVDNPVTDRMTGLLQSSKNDEDSKESRPRRYSASAAQGPLPKRSPRSALNSDTSVEDSSEDSFVSVVPRSSIQSDTSVDSEESIVSVIQRSPSEMDFRDCFMRTDPLCQFPLSEDSERSKRRPPPSPGQLASFWEENSSQTACALSYNSEDLFLSVSQQPAEVVCHKQELPPLEVQMFTLRQLCKDKVSEPLRIKTGCEENSHDLSNVKMSEVQPNEHKNVSGLKTYLQITELEDIRHKQDNFSKLDEVCKPPIDILESTVFVNELKKSDSFIERQLQNKQIASAPTKVINSIEQNNITNELESTKDILTLGETLLDLHQALSDNSDDNLKHTDEEVDTVTEESPSLICSVIEKAEKEATKEDKPTSPTEQEVFQNGNYEIRINEVESKNNTDPIKNEFNQLVEKVPNINSLDYQKCDSFVEGESEEISPVNITIDRENVKVSSDDECCVSSTDENHPCLEKEDSILVDDDICIVSEFMFSLLNDVCGLKDVGSLSESTRVSKSTENLVKDELCKSISISNIDFTIMDEDSKRYDNNNVAKPDLLQESNKKEKNNFGSHKIAERPQTLLPEKQYAKVSRYFKEFVPPSNSKIKLDTKTPSDIPDTELIESKQKDGLKLSTRECENIDNSSPQTSSCEIVDESSSKPSTKNNLEDHNEDQVSPLCQTVQTYKRPLEMVKRGLSVEEQKCERVRGRTYSEGTLWPCEKSRGLRTRSDGTLPEGVHLKDLLNCVVVSGVDPEDPDEDEAFAADFEDTQCENQEKISREEVEDYRRVRAPPLGQQTSSLSLSTSQESLQGNDVGGSVTLHRYYHVFTEGELDHLIETYVENLHIISSYYDHANWCIIAEKVQVWTI